MFLTIFNFLKSFMFFTGSYSNTMFPAPLKEEEEKKYIALMEQGNQEARNILIEHNLRLVAHIVKKYETKYKDTDDLISIGTIGLIKGVDSFKSDKNIKITTYVARCVENEILMFFRSSKKHNNDVSLNDYIGLDKDGNEISLLDVLPDNLPQTDDIISKTLDIEELKRHLGSLNKREKDIIIRRYGLNGTKAETQKEISKELKISRSYVSRIEKRALTKLLRKFMSKEQKIK